MATPLVSARSLTRRYPGVLAMNNVSIDIMAGEVIGLVGKNGAGKSTLIRMLAGVERPDEGSISIDGHDVGAHYTPQAAHHRGLAFMHQELANVPKMSIAENVTLGSSVKRRFGFLLDWDVLHRKVAAVLADLELDVDPRTLVSDLTVVQQRMVMIARALYHKARVLVLDEPSTSLTQSEVDHLHRVVRRMRAAGQSVVYISHRLNEIMEITDKVIVMQDGRVTVTHRTRDITQAHIVAAIAGKELQHEEENLPDEEVAPAPGPTVLSVRELTLHPAVRGLSLDLRAGEILGIAGLVGAGRTEFARLLSGADRAQFGSIAIDGRPISIRTPRDGLHAGIVLLPEDRRHQGLVMGMNVRENITLASLGQHMRYGVGIIDKASERKVVDSFIRRLSVKTPGSEQDVKLLSGGNQQKVVLAKWLARDNKVFIFDEPTQGVDVHAKVEMFDLIRRVVATGKSAIVISSDFSELVALCNRVIIMREGRFVGELVGKNITEPSIVELAYAGETDRFLPAVANSSN